MLISAHTKETQAMLSGTLRGPRVVTAMNTHAAVVSEQKMNEMIEIIITSKRITSKQVGQCRAVLTQNPLH